MTLPIFLAVHLAYGGFMAFAMERRMRSEGEILGLPLVAALVPVALISTPVAAALVRYCSGWFFHGVFMGQGSVPYERFHLGLMLLISLVAAIIAAFGLIFAIAFLSRENRSMARLPMIIGGSLIAITILADPMRMWQVTGTGGKILWAHPAGFFSIILIVALVAAWMILKKKLSEPIEMRF